MLNNSHILVRLSIRAWALLVWIVLSVCAVACDSEEEMSLPEQPDGSMTVSISIKTNGSTGTRAADVYDMIGIMEENTINVVDGDYRILLFDKDGWLVGRFDDIQPVTGEEQNVNQYVVTASLDKTLLDFTVVVLANWEQNGWHYPLLAESITTIDGLMVDVDCQFDVKEGWRPFHENGAVRTGGMPMFGMHSFSVSQEEAKKATGDAPVNLSESERDVIWMVRSMAKIEVVDAMDKINDDDYPRLESVTFAPYMNAGKLIPDAFSNGNGERWNNGSQVGKVSLPAGKTPVTGELALFSIADADTKREKYVAYVAEQNLNQQKAYLYITVRNRPDGITGDGLVTVTYELDVNQETGMRILRNHLYRFNIKSVSSQLINVEYVVCPWSGYTVDIPVFD